MADDEWYKFQGLVRVGKKKKYDIIVCHNLPTNNPGIDISSAFQVWMHKTDEYTSKSFAEYINSKEHMTGNHAYTEEEWNELLKED